MEEILTEVVGEALGVLAYGLLVVALTILGLLAELTGAQVYGAGDATMAAWYVFVGIVLFVASLTLLRDRLLPGVRAMRK